MEIAKKSTSPSIIIRPFHWNKNGDFIEIYGRDINKKSYYVKVSSNLVKDIDLYRCIQINRYRPLMIKEMDFNISCTSLSQRLDMTIPLQTVRFQLKLNALGRLYTLKIYSETNRMIISMNPNLKRKNMYICKTDKEFYIVLSGILNSIQADIHIYDKRDNFLYLQENMSKNNLILPCKNIGLVYIREATHITKMRKFFGDYNYKPFSLDDILSKCSFLKINLDMFFSYTKKQLLENVCSTGEKIKHEKFCKPGIYQNAYVYNTAEISQNTSIININKYFPALTYRYLDYCAYPMIRHENAIYIDKNILVLSRKDKDLKLANEFYILILIDSDKYIGLDINENLYIRGFPNINSYKISIVKSAIICYLENRGINLEWFLNISQKEMMCKNEETPFLMSERISTISLEHISNPVVLSELEDENYNLDAKFCITETVKAVEQIELAYKTLTSN